MDTGLGSALGLGLRVESGLGLRMQLGVEPRSGFELYIYQVYHNCISSSKY